MAVIKRVKQQKAFYFSGIGRQKKGVFKGLNTTTTRRMLWKAIQPCFKNTHNITGSQVSSVILFSTAILAAVRPCVTLSVEELFSEEEKHDSASYLEEVCLKHECGCHGSAVTWTAGTWKFASSSIEEFIQKRHHNKQGWQHDSNACIRRNS